MNIYLTKYPTYKSNNKILLHKSNPINQPISNSNLYSIIHKSNSSHTSKNYNNSKHSTINSYKLKTILSNYNKK